MAFVPIPLALAAGLLAAELTAALYITQRRPSARRLLKPAIGPALFIPAVLAFIAWAQISETGDRLLAALHHGQPIPHSSVQYVFNHDLRLVAGDMPEAQQRALLSAARDAQGAPIFRFDNRGHRTIAAHAVRAETGEHVFALLAEMAALDPIRPALVAIILLPLIGGIAGWHLMIRYRQIVLGPLETNRKATLARLESRLDQTEKQLARSLEERSFLSSELRGALANVEIAVRDRTAQLQSELSAAENASRAKGTFLAAMSHEIRTPLSGILGMASLLAATPLSSEQRDYLVTLKSSGESLLSIINDILDFSKIEAGKLELEQTAFSVLNTVEEAVELFAEAAQSKGIEIGCLVSPEIPSILRGDPGRLRQVLLNLLHNAVKFTSEGEVFVCAELVGLAGRTATIRFEVRDTGIGMSAEQVDRLFQPYIQANAAITRKYGGTGLGLSISRQLAALMGGDIQIETQPGSGSRFSFTASLGVEPAALDLHRRLRETESSSLAGLRVLVVTTNTRSASVLRDRMKAWGARAHRAASVEQAVDDLLSAERLGRPFGQLIVDRSVILDSLDLLTSAKPTSIPLILLHNLGQRPLEKSPPGITHLMKPLRSRALKAALTASANESGMHALAEAVTHANLSASILVAEDNAVNQKLITKLLEKMGHRVELAFDGRAAVQAALTGNFSLVLMDCQMPEMTGYEAAAEIRRRGGRVPIVALTANALAGDREKCVASGMDDFLAKPIEPSQLAETLSRWLKISEVPVS